MITLMMRSMAQSYLIAGVVITLMMIVLIGSVRIGLLSMVANLFPISKSRMAITVPTRDAADYVDFVVDIREEGARLFGDSADVTVTGVLNLFVSLTTFTSGSSEAPRRS